MKEISVFDRRASAWQREPWNGFTLKGRFGHTACVNGTDIYIWGGMNKFIKQSKTRSCISIVNRISTHTNSVEEIKLGLSNATPKPRRYHSAALIGMHMIIYGGISDKNTVLDDVFDFDIVNGRWNDVYPNGARPGPLAYHSSIGVYDDVYEGMGKVWAATLN